MLVAAFQFDVQRGNVSANLARVEQALGEAARRKVRLVVLPEMWPTSFDPAGAGPENDEALARVRALSGELGLVVCGSAFAPVPGAKPRNRLHVFADAETLFGYDKLHLFSPTAERELFSAGDEPPPTVDSPLGRLSGVICYDLRFGPLLEVPFRAGAELFVVPAQWPSARAAHWTALVRGRAAEGQAIVVASNRCGTEQVGARGRPLEFPGNSMIVGPDGASLATGEGREGLVVADVALESVRDLRRRVPVARDRRPALYRRWAK